MKIDNYFGSPLWSEEKPDFIKSTIKATDKYIKQARQVNKVAIKSTGDFGLSHHSKQLLSDPAFKDLIDYIGNKAWSFLDWHGFDMSHYQTMISQMWVQEFAKKGGGHHSLHVHPNDHVAGFYFLKCSMKTSFPIFHYPRPGAQMTKLLLKDHTKITLGTDTIHRRPTPGMLMLFNGYLPHEFSLDAGHEPFRFIHFNLQAVLKGMAKDVV